MKVAALAYLFTGLCVLAPAVFGLLTGHIGIYLLVYGIGASAFFVVAQELYKAGPVRTYYILFSLFLVGAAGYLLVLIGPILEASLRLGTEPGVFLGYVSISAAVGLAQAAALVALLRTRRASTAQAAP